MQLQDYIADVQELIHDSIGVSWPINRVISRINEARLWTSMDMKCVRTLVSGVQLIQGQEIYIISGAVVGATVTAGGSNYGTASTVPVTFSPPPAPGGVGGITALGFGNLTAGSLTSITMTRWGNGYTSPPLITIGGSGTGAAAIPVTLINVLYPISVSFIFNGIRTTLRYLPFSEFQAYARILGILFTSIPGVWTYVAQQATQGVSPFGFPGGIVYIQPPPNQTYISEWDCTFFTSPLVSATDIDTQLTEPWDRAPQFAAASLLLMKDQDAGRARSAFMKRQYDMMVPKIVTGVGDVRIPNIYNRNFQRAVAR